MRNESYRDILKREFESRRARNSFYSLRAFARDLEISAARLSEALNERRGISPELARRLASRLDLSAAEAELFALSAQAKHARSSAERNEAEERIAELLREPAPPQPKLRTVVDWVHEAVLKMSERDGPGVDVALAATKLAVPQFMVTGAVRFLTRLGYLKGAASEKAFLRKNSEGRRLNVDPEQIIERARKAYLTEGEGAGLFHHEAFLLEAKDAEKAKAMLLECFEKIRKLEKRGKSARVHMVSAQTYALERSEK